MFTEINPVLFRPAQKNVGIKNIVLYDRNGNLVFPVTSQTGDLIYGRYMPETVSATFNKTNTAVQSILPTAYTSVSWTWWDVVPDIYQMSVTYDCVTNLTWVINNTYVYNPTQAAQGTMDTINFFPSYGTTPFNNNGAPPGYTNFSS